MNICPNFKNKKVKQEFDELVSIFGEDGAYYLWDRSKGMGMELAPNGADSKLFQTLLKLNNGDRVAAIKAKAKVYTKSFTDWFGDWINSPSEASKVVDENGEPRVMYHGSPDLFDTFSYDFFGRTDPGDNGRGFYFAYRKETAEDYGDNIYPVFLNVKHPFIHTGFDTQSKVKGFNRDYNPTNREMLQKRIDSVYRKIELDKEALEEYKEDEFHTSILNKRISYNQTLLNSLQQELSTKPKDYLDSKLYNTLDEYDGVIEHDEHYQIVVRNPNQVKSATYNENYSTTSDNIYEHRGRNIREELEQFKHDLFNATDIEKNRLINSFNKRLKNWYGLTLKASHNTIEYNENSENAQALQELIDIETPASSDELNNLFSLLSSKFNRRFGVKFVTGEQLVKKSGNATTKCYIESVGEDYIIYIDKNNYPSYENLAEEMLHPLMRTIQKRDPKLFRQFLISCRTSKNKTVQSIINQIEHLYNGKSKDIINNEIVTQVLAYKLKRTEQNDDPVFIRLINKLVELINSLGFNIPKFFKNNLTLDHLAYILKFESIKFNIDKLDTEFEHLSSDANIVDEILDNGILSDIQEQLSRHGIEDSDYAVRQAINRTRQQYMEDEIKKFKQDYQASTKPGFFQKVMNFFRSSRNKVHNIIKNPTSKQLTNVRDQSTKEFDETLYDQIINSILTTVNDIYESTQNKNIKHIFNVLRNAYDDNDKNTISTVLFLLDTAINDRDVILNNNNIRQIFRVLNNTENGRTFLQERVSKFNSANGFYNALIGKSKNLSQEQQDTVNSFINDFIDQFISQYRDLKQDSKLNTLTQMYYQQNYSVTDEGVQTYDTILSGLKSRLISIEKSNFGSKNIAHNIKVLIKELEDKHQNDIYDMYNVYVLFLEQAEQDFKKSTDYFKQFIEDPSTGKLEKNISELDPKYLQYFKTDVLGYYEYIIDKYIKQLKPGREENKHLSDDQVEQIVDMYRNSVDMLKEMSSRVYGEVLDKYVSSIVDEFTEQEYSIGDKEELKYNLLHWINGEINNGNVGVLENYVGNANNSKSQVVRMIATMLNNDNKEVNRQTSNKIAKLYKAYKKARPFLSKLGVDPRNYGKTFVELDKNGMPTGRWLEEYNIGQYEQDKQKEIDRLNSRYGTIFNEDGDVIVDFTIPGEEERYNKYMDALDDWIEENADRPYTAEYYKARRRILGHTAQEALNSIQYRIDLLLDKCTDEEGFIYTQKLNPSERQQLNYLYREKKELGNPYVCTFDASDKILTFDKKTGEDLEIAERIQEWNQYIRGKVNYTPNYEKYDAALEKLKNNPNVTQLEIDRFISDNTQTKLTDQFYEDLNKVLPHVEQNEEYLAATLRIQKIIGLTKDKGGYVFPNLLRLNDDAWKELKIQEQIKIDNKVKATKDDFLYSKEELKEMGLEDFKTARYPVTVNVVQNGINTSIPVITHLENLARAQMATNPRALDEFYEKYYIEDHGTLRPLSVFFTTCPTSNKYIETVPVNGYSELDQTSSLANPFYHKDNKRKEQPRDHYKSKRYSELYKTNKDGEYVNKEAVDFYESLLDMMQETIDKLTTHPNLDKYKMPQITEEKAQIFTRRICSKKFLTSLGAYSQMFRITEKNDDMYWEDLAMRPDQTTVESVQVRYIRDLENPADVSCDIIKSMTMFYSMALNYELKSKTVPKIENIISKLERVSKSNNSKGNTQLKRARTELEMYGYGKVQIGFGQTGTKMSNMQKFWSTLSNSAKSISNVALLSGKVIVAAKGFGVSFYKTNYEAIIGTLFGGYFNTGDLISSYTDMAKDLIHAISSIGTPDVSSLIQALMRRNGLVTSPEESFSDTNKHRIRRLLKHFAMGPFTLGDYTINTIWMLTQYHATRLVENPGTGLFELVNYDECIHMFTESGYSEKEAKRAYKNASSRNMFKMFCLNKEGEAVLKDKVVFKINGKKYEFVPSEYITKKVENRIVGTVQQRGAIVTGVLGEPNKSSAQRNPLGSLASAMRGFLFSQGGDMYKFGNDFAHYQYHEGKLRDFGSRDKHHGQYNTETGRIEPAMMYSVWKALKNIFKYLPNKLRKANQLNDRIKDGEKFTKEDWRNVLRFCFDLAGTIILLTIAATLLVPLVEDYPDEWWSWALLFLTGGMAIELTSMFAITTVLDLMTSVTTSYSFIIKVLQFPIKMFNYATGNSDPEKNITNGAYKHKPALLKDFSETVLAPTGIAGYYKTFSPSIPGLDTKTVKGQKVPLEGRWATPEGAKSSYGYYNQNVFPATLIPKPEVEKKSSTSNTSKSDTKKSTSSNRNDRNRGRNSRSYNSRNSR